MRSQCLCGIIYKTEVIKIRQEPEEIIAYCDGRCEGFGVEAIGKYGFVIYEGRRKIAEGEGMAGEGKDMTANVAEYVAVLKALEWLRGSGYQDSEIRIRSDSKLVMQQLGMLCVTRSLRLVPWHRKVRELARDFQVHYEWIPRAWNTEADAHARNSVLE